MASSQAGSASLDPLVSLTKIQESLIGKALKVPYPHPSTLLLILPVTYHVSPNMVDHERRRFIGNTMVLVIFHQAGTPFEADQLEDFGPMCQMLAIVQPVQNLYR